MIVDVITLKSLPNSDVILSISSRLIISADSGFDIEYVSQQLQLRGSIQNGKWIFPAAERLAKRDGDAHAQYWMNILDRHKEGKNALLANGYHLILEFSNGILELSPESVGGLARQRIAIHYTGNT